MSMETILSRLISDIKNLKSPEGCLYAGIPYFKGIFGRDSLISGWQLLKHDSGIARDALRFLARHQGQRVAFKSEEEPGRILHVYDFVASTFQQRVAKLLQYTIQDLPYYGSVDSTPLFVIVAGEYFQETGDRRLIVELWPSIEKAMDWIVNYADLNADGFAEYKRKNPFGLRNQNWKDTAIYLNMKLPVASVEVQGYVYAAYNTAASLSALLGKHADEWETKAGDMKQSFNERFWMNDMNFCVLALDGDKKQVKEVASNPGHLLLTGILDKDRERRVVERLFEKDMFTEYGLRTHSSLSKYFRRSCTLGSIWPHDNWVFWLGLRKCGYTEQADRVRVSLIKAYHKLGYIPEYYDVVDNEVVLLPRLTYCIRGGKSCYPQAWASGALLNMIDTP